MLKIGIIGSNGFLGQAILDKLLFNNDLLIFAFNRSTSKRNHKNIHNFVGEISNESEEFIAFIRNDYDILIHLGEKPTYDINYLLSSQLLYNKILSDNIRVNPKIKKIIYLSSMAVYGQGKLKKEDDKLLPLNNYGFAKKISEGIFSDLSNYNKIVIIFRPSNLYGIGANSGVIYNFINNINNNEEIIIYGDGNQEREYLYIDDCVDAIIETFNYNKDAIFNLSSGESQSLKSILSILKYNFKLDFSVKYLPADDTNSIQILSEDITHINKELGWKPKIDILNGLSKLLGKKYI